MGLKKAARWFARTPLYGWDGTAFVALGVKAALMPYDRFISGQEFGMKRRMLTLPGDTPVPAGYHVLRLGASGPLYLLGWLNEDYRREDPYNLSYLVLHARYQGQLLNLQKVTAASGMSLGVQDVDLGTWHCDSEHITYTNSPEFTQMRVSDMTLTLPADCPATADHEFVLGGKRYVLQEVYRTVGFVQARAQVKNGP